VRYNTLSPLSTLAPGRKGFDDSYIKKLELELNLDTTTSEALLDHQVHESTLLALTRIELEARFNITLNDAVSLHNWSARRLKEEEDKEHARAS